MAAQPPPVPPVFHVVKDSLRTRRSFRIVCGLVNGYALTRTMRSAADARLAIRKWQINKAKHRQVFCSVIVREGVACFIRRSTTNREPIPREERVIILEGELGYAKDRGASTKENVALLNELASSVAAELGQDRAYCTLGDNVWILEREYVLHPEDIELL